MKKRGRRKEKSFLKKEYLEVFNYLKESKNFIYFVIGIFLFFSFVGFFIPIPEAISNQLLEYFEELVRQTEGFGFIEMISFLFLNNLTASFFGLIFGVILGIFPFFNAAMNGFVLGFVLEISINENGIFSLFRLLPHGIFELPALFISLGLGVKFGTFVFSEKKGECFKKYFRKSIKAFVFVVVPLLVLAAIIESALIVFGR